MPIEIGQRFLETRDSRLELGRQSHFMGIVNATPDSFSDGGRLPTAEAAAVHGLKLLNEGASCIDIGGESTRPGYAPVSEEDESARVLPVLERIMAERPAAFVSVDTTKIGVARAALNRGARMVNDIWGLQRAPKMAEAIADAGAAVTIMRNGRADASPGPILDRVRASWDISVEIARQAGIPETGILLDPGIGFGTTRQEDLEILRGMQTLVAYGFPLLIGVSRKRVTATPLGLSLDLRLEPTLAAAAAGISAGVDFFRVHDVGPHKRLAALSDLVFRGGEWHG